MWVKALSRNYWNKNKLLVIFNPKNKVEALKVCYTCTQLNWQRWWKNILIAHCQNIVNIGYLTTTSLSALVWCVANSKNKIWPEKKTIRSSQSGERTSANFEVFLIGIKWKTSTRTTSYFWMKWAFCWVNTNPCRFKIW